MAVDPALARSPLFTDLEEQELEAVVKRMRPREFAEGQLIVWVTWSFLNESGVFCAGAASSIGSIQTFPSLSECGPTGMSENRHSGASASATTSTSAPRPAI